MGTIRVYIAVFYELAVLFRFDFSKKTPLRT